MRIVFSVTGDNDSFASESVRFHRRNLTQKEYAAWMQCFFNSEPVRLAMIFRLESRPGKQNLKVSLPHRQY